MAGLEDCVAICSSDPECRFVDYRPKGNPGCSTGTCSRYRKISYCGKGNVVATPGHWAYRVGDGCQDQCENILHARSEEMKSERTCGMIFHMTEVKRMLASVDEIIETGRTVQLGKDPNECFVKNTTTGEEIYLEKKGGVYVMTVWVMIGDRRKRAQIVVDSGASECVMPKNWLPESAATSPKKGVKFTCANGKDMGNFGRKLVEFKSVFTRQA